MTSLLMSARENEQDQQMYGNNKDTCPVISLDLYLSKLSPKCDALFHQPLQYPKQAGWYTAQPTGKQKLSDMMARIPKLELALATGGSVRKLQWKKAREAVIPPKQPRASVNQRNISIMSSSTTSPVSSPAASPISTPAHTPETSPSQPPMISPASSVPSPTPVLTEQLPQTNSIGAHFKVGDNVCIASGDNTYDFATVEKYGAQEREDITYLKKMLGLSYQHGS
ncbi:unnamed protein product [Mytilus edulis]|uniref:Uncharacterized protein n=1 Tax=Mytilus edulis TaxID=6550 RepID=A0A8S3Q0C4_MYTED|nr:unnamed protein product [Mytilus edulis]